MEIQTWVAHITMMLFTELEAGGTNRQAAYTFKHKNLQKLLNMGKSINILDKDYIQWIRTLSSRYRQSQIKAVVRVNEEMLRFYWELGRDLESRFDENKYGSGFYASVSRSLKEEIPGATCFSPTNLKYMRFFFSLYNPKIHQYTIGNQNRPQPVDNSTALVPEAIHPQVVDELLKDLFSVPWGHHRFIIDKCHGNAEKALFFVRQTVANGWSRSMLLNFLDTDFYERQGKALTNFERILPEVTSDLAQEITKDPYNFAFAGITGRYNERLLKDKLLGNITQFLVELGTGFAYVGKEYRIQVGEREQFIDLLFYNLNLSCYVVVEVKIGKFEFADIGQLGGYIVACNHILRKEGRDNPTIGLLICKEKDRIQAQYALESSSQPIGISEYELEKFYPQKVEGTIPSIEEIEVKLNQETSKR